MLDGESAIHFSVMRNGAVLVSEPKIETIERNKTEDRVKTPSRPAMRGGRGFFVSTGELDFDS